MMISHSNWDTEGRRADGLRFFWIVSASDGTKYHVQRWDAHQGTIYKCSCNDNDSPCEHTEAARTAMSYGIWGTQARPVRVITHGSDGSVKVFQEYNSTWEHNVN